MSRISQLYHTAQDSLIPVAPTIFMAMEPTVKMHAACEECRGRKLRCSGHRPQCDRCKKDQVTCTYSPQKRMGRPRKLKPQSTKLPERHSACLGHPYTTPEPVPHLEAMHYHQSEEQVLGSEWVQLFSEFETEMHNPNSLVYDLNWSTGEGFPNNCPLDRHAHDFGNIHAPVSIQNHLVAPHTLEVHTQHIQVPKLHISDSLDGPVSFDYSSSEFTGLSHILGHSPPLPPAPPVSGAGGSPIAMSLNDASVDISTLPHCDCIYSFLISINLLKTHLAKSPISFQAAISTSRSAIATATYSLSCQTCQSDDANNIFSNDVECISDMFLGALLPMLCIFYTKALESIEQMTGNQKVRVEGQEMDIAPETWKEMTRLAMVKEASRVNKLVDKMGKLSLKNNSMIGGAFCYSVDALWEPLFSRLSDFVRNADPRTRERMLAESIGVS